MRYARAVTSLRKRPASLLVAMFYERAWRDPRLSHKFLQYWKRALEMGLLPLDATWLGVRRTCRMAPADRPNHRFWSGPSAFSAARGPWAWEGVEVERVVRAILQCGGVVEAVEHVARMSAMPYVSQYFAFGYLRNLEALGLLRLRNAAKAASAMSAGVHALTQIFPIRTWWYRIGKLRLHGGCKFRLGDAALVVCETAKALQCLGFSLPRDVEGGDAEFIEEFGAGCGSALISFLQSCTPLTLDELHAEVGIRSSETALVDRFFPRTRTAWDRRPHFCRGSESGAPLLLRRLRHSGYMVSTCDPTESMEHA